MQYDAATLHEAREAARLERGPEWERALAIGYDWLAYRSTPVIEPSDDPAILVVTSTNGKRYTVPIHGATCSCPAYQEPLLAGRVEEVHPCKHRGAVIIHGHYNRLVAQIQARAAHEATFSEAAVPYVPGATYAADAWVGTPHEATERARLGDAAVDAAITRRAELPAYDRQADIDQRAAWMEQHLHGPDAI